MITNPYSEMLISIPQDRVFGRDRDLGYILRSITQRTPSSIAIAGLRTMGKTTLLHQIKAVSESPELLRARRAWVGDDFQPGAENSDEAAPRRELVAVYVDLEGSQSTQDVLTMLLRQLRTEVLTSPRFKSGGNLPGADRDDTEEQAFDKLRDALVYLAPADESAQPAVRIVFLLDNFDAVDPSARTPLDNWLRSLRRYAAFVVAFEDPPTESDSFLLGITYDVTLGALDETAATQLIRQSKEFGPAEVKFLLRVAGRQPFLLVTACAALLDLYHIDPASIGRLRDRDGAATTEFEAQFINYLLLQRTVEQAVRRMWVRLREDERQAVLLLARGQTLDPDVRKMTLPGLLDKGVALTAGSDPQLFSALFAEYVLRQQSAQQAPSSSQPAAHAPDYAGIRQALGPKDQAVLGYFIEHPNTIITFGTLLDRFWGTGDNTTKERKRRLDAAIHRIRSAMDGRGLDGPEHLRNIRGKGFEFVL